MKHKTESNTVAKMISLFESNEIAEDGPVALQKDESKVACKTLLCSHFDIMIMHMNNDSLPHANQDFMLQKYLQPVNNLRYISIFNKGVVQIRSEPHNQVYLINGKYSNLRSLPNPSSDVEEIEKSELEGLTNLICSYISFNSGNVSECELE